MQNHATTMSFQTNVIFTNLTRCCYKKVSHEGLGSGRELSSYTTPLGPVSSCPADQLLQGQCLDWSLLMWVYCPVALYVERRLLGHE